MRAHPSVPNADVDRCFTFYEWIRTRANDLPIPTEREVRIPVICYSLAIDHLLGIATLLQSGIYASAFSLGRPAFEGYVRGAWLRACGQPADFDNYEADRQGASFFTMIEALEATPNFAGGTLSRARLESVPILHSFAHGGFNQAARNWSAEAIEPNYSVDDVTRLARLASATALLSFQLLAAEASRLDLAEEALELMKDWSTGKLDTRPPTSPA